MDYKKLIKSRATREAILRALSFVPDKLMIQIQWKIKMGFKLDMVSPKRFTEKLQWCKLYYRDPLMKQCVDKYDVQAYVKQCGLSSVLNEIYAIYETPDDVDFDKLPDSFVLKDTLGGGGNAVIIVQDKKSADLEKIRLQMQQWVDTPFNLKHPGREWVYDGHKHRIIAEKMLKLDKFEDLPDYKFFCFNGEPFCLYVMKNYVKHHEDGILGFLTPDFKLLPAHRKDFAPMVEQPEKPKNYDKMVEIAKKLSAPFPHVRVDLYNIDGQIVFGEMTFFTASGYIKFEPDQFDFEMGQRFELPKKSKIK